MNEFTGGPKNLTPVNFPQVCIIARAAGQKILEFRDRRAQGKELGETAKADGSPVTQADLAANQIILDGLSQIGCGDPNSPKALPVLSEESPIDWSTRKSWQTYWLVDPLDGTRDFINGTGEYTVNIALIADGTPVWGVVYLPETDQLFCGGASFGASCNGRPIVQAAASRELVAIESHFHPSEKNREFYRQYGINRVIKAGSSLKFCRVATGEADIYPRLGPTNEWDTAAGQAVLEGAGGQVLTWPDLQPMKYHKEDLRNPPFVAVGARPLNLSRPAL